MNTFVNGLKVGQVQGHVKVKVTAKSAHALREVGFGYILHASGGPKDIRKYANLLNFTPKCHICWRFVTTK